MPQSSPMGRDPAAVRLFGRMTQTATEALAPEVFDEAYRRVAPLVHRTPLLHSTSLSNETGYDVWLKAEMFQRTGSYKVRGPSNKLPQLSQDEQRAGVICSSAGNHAQGVAYAAARLGIPATVLMASNATPAKIAATKSYGAEVILHGTIWDEANDEAMRLRDERGLTFIHPFDDLQLIAGQGTVGLEILEDAPDAAHGRRPDRRRRADLRHRRRDQGAAAGGQGRRGRVHGRTGHDAERRARRARHARRESLRDRRAQGDAGRREDVLDRQRARRQARHDRRRA